MEQRSFMKYKIKVKEGSTEKLNRTFLNITIVIIQLFVLF